MQLATLQDEMAALNSEVTRLRMMVHKANMRAEEFASKPQPLNQAFPVYNNPGAGQQHQQQSGSPTVYVDPQTGQGHVPLPGQPLTVLPQMFSGLEGTARLFKLLMETYPWLVPQDVREAQTEIALLKVQLAEEKAKNEKLVAAAAGKSKGSKKKDGKDSKDKKSRKKKERSPSTSSASSTSSSGSSTDNTSSTDDADGTTTEDTSPPMKKKDSFKKPGAKSTPNPTPNRGGGGTPMGRGIGMGGGAGVGGGGFASDGVLNLRRPQAKKGKINTKRFQSYDTSDEEEDGALGATQGSAQGSVKKSPQQQQQQQVPAEHDYDF